MSNQFLIWHSQEPIETPEIHRLPNLRFCRTRAWKFLTTMPRLLDLMSSLEVISSNIYICYSCYGLIWNELQKQRTSFRLKISILCNATETKLISLKRLKVDDYRKRVYLIFIYLTYQGIQGNDQRFITCHPRVVAAQACASVQSEYCLRSCFHLYTGATAHEDFGQAH